MKYMDVRVRLPVNKLGEFIDDLPAYAQMVGYDKLEEAAPSGKSKGGRPPGNGTYIPGKGTAPDAILKLLAKGPLLRVEIMRTLNRRFKERASGSGFYQLVQRGLIIKQKDGRYAVTHG